MGAAYDRSSATTEAEMMALNALLHGRESATQTYSSFLVDIPCRPKKY